MNVYLTRVPSIGEDIAIEATIYRVSGVQHSALDQGGRATFGSHAYVDVVEIVEPEWPTMKPRGKKNMKQTLKVAAKKARPS